MRRVLLLLLAPLLLAGLPPLPARAVGFRLTDPTALRVTVTTPGVQQLTAADLAAVGWDLATVAPATVRLWRQGAEQPLAVTTTATGQLARLQFAAGRSDSRWTAQTVWWLTHGGGPGRRGPPDRAGDPWRWEADTRYESTVASVRGDRWFAADLAVGAALLTVPLELPQAVVGGTPLQVAVSAATAGARQLALTLDGQPLAPLRWTAAEPVTVIAALPALAAGTHTLALQLVGGPPALLDRLDLPTVRVPFPAAPARPLIAPGPGHDLAAGPAPGQRGATFLIVTHRAFTAALGPLVAAHQARGEVVGVVDVQSAYDVWAGGDRDPEAIRQLIRTAVAQWAPAPRQVLLVGAGTVRLRAAPDAVFIPPYLVDVDPTRGEIGCDTCYARLAVGDVRAQPMPDLPIGRLPVRTLAEARAVVAKTVTALTGPPPGAWRTRAILLADNDRAADGTPDGAGSFVQTAEGAAAQLRGFDVRRHYYAPARPRGGAYWADVADLRCALFAAWDGGCGPPVADAGAALLVYVGHGSFWQWGATEAGAAVPYLVYLYDADGRHGGARLPILLSMTCLSGDVANPTLEPLDARLLLQPEGGVVAALSASGAGVNTGHATLLAGLLPALRAGQGLGAAHLAGLAALHADGRFADLAYSFSVLGDPAVALPWAPRQTTWLPLVGGGR